MKKQVAINLYNGVCGTLHAVGGTQCPSNILPPLKRVRFAQTAFMVIYETDFDKRDRRRQDGDVSRLYRPLRKTRAAQHLQPRIQGAGDNDNKRQEL